VPELAFQASVASCWVVLLAVPVPVSDTTAGELEALLVKESFPDAAPELLGVNFTVIAADFPAAIVTGKETPLTVNSELVVVAEETITLVPEAVRVADIALLDPTATLPRLALPGETARVPAAPPVPESGIVSVRLLALESTVRLPVVAPPVLGRNKSLKVMLAAGARVTGGVIPVRAKAEPFVFADEMTSGAAPTFFNVSDSVFELPTATLPKLPLGRVAETFPCTPQPFSESATVGLEALLAKEMVPCTLSKEGGANRIVTFTLWPLPRVTGKAGAVTV